ncbi:MAG: flagellar brake protein [Lachnospiraceae bacterium]|nr:flagellar brake protein [Lachnospiraceae bacterium]
MLSKFIENGNRIDLQSLDRWKGSEEVTPKVYQSRVIDILTEDTLEIEMPLEQSKLVLLPIDSEYEMIFYGESGLYQCYARITDRYKSNNVYMLVMELISDLSKYQRREYYRFSCAIEMQVRALTEEEMRPIENNEPYRIQLGLTMQEGVIVDISGGGIRFMSKERFEAGSLIYCSYPLQIGDTRKQFEVLGKILSVKNPENKPGYLEYRMEYFRLNVNSREEIIRYIFEEERKSRKKERLL